MRQPAYPKISFLIPERRRSREPAYEIVSRKSFLGQQGSISSSLGPGYCLQSPTETRYIRLYLDFSITLLSNGFPNTWAKTGHHQGHGWASWETCSEVLPHVSYLMALVQMYKLSPIRLETFAELIFRSGS